MQIEHLAYETFVHQLTYTKKVLKIFYMDKPHPLNTPMQVRLLDVKKDIFQPWNDKEELVGLEGAIMYLVNNTRLNIAFSINLLATYSSSLTKKKNIGIELNIYFVISDILNMVGI